MVSRGEDWRWTEALLLEGVEEGPEVETVVGFTLGKCHGSDESTSTKEAIEDDNQVE